MGCSFLIHAHGTIEGLWHILIHTYPIAQVQEFTCHLYCIVCLISFAILRNMFFIPSTFIVAFVLCT